MSDLHAPQDDPSGDATQKLSSYLTVALAAAQAAVQRATLRAQRQAHAAQPDALELGQARARWAPLLSPDARRVDAPAALAAWTAAQPYRESLPEAERAAVGAEERLRELRPAAMARYDALRRGLPPEEAMREVTPLLLAEQQPAAPGPATGNPAATTSTRPDSGGGEDLSARYAPVVRDALPAELADQVLAERAWPRLAAALHAAEGAGADPAELLRAAAEQRELGTAKSNAQVLAHRLAARTPAHTAAASYPVPLVPAGARPAAGEEGAEGALAAAGRRLEQSAEAELAAAHAADRTPDDPTTPEVDEHREGLAAGHAHTRTADELHAHAQQLHSEASTTGSDGPERTPAVTAARSYPAPPSAAAPPPRHAPTGPPPTGGPPAAARSRRGRR